MKRELNSIFIVIMAFLSHFEVMHAQNEPNSEAIEQIIEDVSTDTDEAEDVELIEYYRRYPIPLLSASGSDLAAIPGISLITSRRISRYLADHEFISYAALADSLNLSPWQEILLENCTVPTRKTSPSYHDFTYRARSISRLGDVKGIENGQFKGSPIDIYQRGSYRTENLKAGFLIDKDMGERSLADFYSGYIKSEVYIFDAASVDFVLGDYSVEAGMGGLLWRSFGMRKSAAGFTSALAKGRGLRHYTSAMESHFFRGAAAQSSFSIASSIFNVTAFYSNRDLAANINELDGTASSIYSTGLFRTETEISKLNSVNEIAAGGIIEYNLASFTVGATALNLNYDKLIKSESSSAFAGKSGILASTYIFYGNKEFLLASELSLDNRGKHNFKAGFTSESREMDFLLYYRNSHREFRSPYGYNFGEFSYASNEKGIFTGFSYKSIKNMKVALYADLYESDGSTYLVPGRVSGIETELQLDYKLSRQDILLCRADYESKTETIRDEENKKQLYQRERTSVRLESQNEISRELSFRVRVEACHIYLDDYRGDELGMMAFAEIKWSPIRDLHIGGRYSIFSTDSYESAIWQFEYAMPGILSTRALYGGGSREYVYIKVRPFDQLTFWLRYAAYARNSVSTMGSGLLEIAGNIERTVYLQMDIDI